MDYILFTKTRKDVDLSKINENEVSEIGYFSMDGRDGIQDFLDKALVHTAENKERNEEMMRKDPRNTILISPWFKILYDEFLMDWWKDIDSIIDDKVKDTVSPCQTIFDFL